MTLYVAKDKSGTVSTKGTVESSESELDSENEEPLIKVAKRWEMNQIENETRFLQHCRKSEIKSNKGKHLVFNAEINKSQFILYLRS